jgi:hypothetical protein
MISTGENRRTLWKTCPFATVSTTNLTLTVPGANPGLCSERAANYVCLYFLLFSFFFLLFIILYLRLRNTLTGRHITGTNTNLHTLSGIRTHNLSIHAIKNRSPYRAVIVTSPARVMVRSDDSVPSLELSSCDLIWRSLSVQAAVLVIWSPHVTVHNGPQLCTKIQYQITWIGQKNAVK